MGSPRLEWKGHEGVGAAFPLNWALQVDPKDRAADAARGARALSLRAPAEYPLHVPREVHTDTVTRPSSK